jgi:predicted nucleic acid-binding protein
MPKDAVLDSSFWINAFRASLTTFLADDFTLYAPSAVVDEVERFISSTESLSDSGAAFKEWRENGRIQVKEPESHVNWFHPGENAAIALAIEQRFQLLLDDNPPYHRAKEHDLQVVSTADYIAALYTEGRLTYREAIERLKSTEINKDVTRKTLNLLALIAQVKGDRT